MEIVPSEIGRLKVGETTYLISPETDVIHRFSELGSNILRVTMPDGKYKELHATDEFVDRLVSTFHLGIIERTNITRDEYDRLLKYREKQQSSDSVMQHLLDSVMADKPEQGKLF